MEENHRLEAMTLSKLVSWEFITFKQLTAPNDVKHPGNKVSRSNPAEIIVNRSFPHVGFVTLKTPVNAQYSKLKPQNYKIT